MTEAVYAIVPNTKTFSAQDVIILLRLCLLCINHGPGFGYLLLQIGVMGLRREEGRELDKVLARKVSVFTVIQIGNHCTC